MISIFKKILLALAFAITAKATLGQQVKIDHVICVVKDIEKATKEYEDKGFIVKKGRLHKNGLINAHIKFRNQSSFELMSLKGKPGDAVARTYEKLLNDKEGGVFVALTVPDTEKLQQKLFNNNIQHKVIKAKNWTYITFPDTSGFAHFFFIKYHISIKDDSKTLLHSNNIALINKVYVEGNEKVIALLKTIGLNETEPLSDSEIGTVTEFKTPTGNISIVQAKTLNKRFRLKAIIFGKGDNSETIKIYF